MPNKRVLENKVELRVLQEEDANELFQLIDTNREYLSKYLPWPKYVRRPEDSKNFIQEKIEENKNNNPHFGIYFEDTLVGIAGFHPINLANKKCSLGYWIGEGFQGKGIMTIAVKELKRIAIEELDLNRVVIQCATSNKGSEAVAKKLGFEFEGIMKANEIVGDNIYDHLTYAYINPKLH